ncbi:hypothetical protein ANN_16313 [Periplaneta americana]|uniref:Uncharacterized protein n=1 Tax=Periplaneta americana TaxID=6978 RepID=A0ABQ8SIM8_PERAM|nr:hypothetical protein ANN_16313 [Periplaneta americana]
MDLREVEYDGRDWINLAQDCGLISTDLAGSGPARRAVSTGLPVFICARYHRAKDVTRAAGMTWSGRAAYSTFGSRMSGARCLACWTPLPTPLTLRVTC